MELHETNYLRARKALEESGIVNNEHYLNTLLAVSEQTGIPVDRITQRLRVTEIVYARKLWIYLLNVIVGLAKKEISRSIQIPASRVHEAIDKVTEEMELYGHVKVDIQSLTEKLQQYA